MIVIADTSPLRYLILVQASDVLPELFHRVLIPDEAYAELRHPGAPGEVQRWIAALPLWLEVRSISPATVLSHGSGCRRRGRHTTCRATGSAGISINGRCQRPERGDAPWNPEYRNSRSSASRIQEWQASAAKRATPFIGDQFLHSPVSGRVSTRRGAVQVGTAVIASASARSRRASDGASVATLARRSVATEASGRTVSVFSRRSPFRVVRACLDQRLVGVAEGEGCMKLHDSLRVSRAPARRVMVA